MKLSVVLARGEDGKIVAHVPALRGCWSQGNTREEALRNIQEAIAGWLEVQQETAVENGGEVEVEKVEV